LAQSFLTVFDLGRHAELVAFHGSTGHLSFEAACLAVSFATCPIDGPVRIRPQIDLRKLQE
jgi:hypothetical protein